MKRKGRAFPGKGSIIIKCHTPEANRKNKVTRRRKGGQKALWR